MPDAARREGDALLEAVLGIWREVLGGQAFALTADSNFFLNGGDSLHLLRVLVRVRERLGVELNLRAAADFSTPGKMARCCAAAGERRVARAGSVQNAKASIPERYCCTPGQSALWFAEQLGGASGLYNTALILHLRGDLQVAILARAMASLFDRHEVLRTRFEFDTRAQGLVAIVMPQPELKLEAILMSPADCARHLRALAARPFDLAAGPLWRVQLLSSGPREWALLLCMHHSITDGWSGGVLLRHLAEAYNALLDNAQGLPAQVEREFRWFCQRQVATEAQLQWWREYLRGADQLPGWPPTGARRWPFAMAVEEELLAADIAGLVRSTTIALRVDPSVVFITALRRALHVLTGLDELCIGIPANVRDSSAQEAAVGYFVNLLVTRDRINASADPLTDLRTVQGALTGALFHRAIPFPELARQLKPALLPSGNPWCDVLFAFQNLPRVEPTFAGLEVELEPLALPRGQYPLKIELANANEGYVCRIEYARELLAPHEVRHLLAAIRNQLVSFGTLASNS